MTLLIKLQDKFKKSPDNWLRKTAKQLYVNSKTKGFRDAIISLFYGNALKSLAMLYGTNKGGRGYTERYEEHFSALRKKPLNILEIGVGGNQNPELGGNSLRMWRTYFKNSRIYGIDIYDKSPHDEKRIKTLKGSQISESFLTEVIDTIGRVDIIIDDGSHKNEHVIKSFNILFPKLSDNGWYVVEDIETSYWPKFGGNSQNFNELSTSMGFFKQLTDGLNHNEFLIPNYEPNYFEKHIVAMHFYRNIVFIKKGLN